MIKILSLCCFAAVLFHCRRDIDVTPAPPVITDSYECAAACANLAALHCVEGDPIDMGTRCNVSIDCKNVYGKPDPGQECIGGRCITSCTNFCIATQNEGVWLDPGCVKTVDSCTKVDVCPLRVKRNDSGQ